MDMGTAEGTHIRAYIECLRISKILYPIFKPFSQCYFYFWRGLFWSLNSFRKRQRVQLCVEDEDPLLFISATEAARRIREGETTSSQLVNAYIERIGRVNGIINAVVQDNYSAARVCAQEIDDYLHGLDKTSEEFANLAKTKPLLGVPFTAKDNILIKGFLCTAGVPCRKDAPPCTEDAECVTRLKESGAILLAVTNVPELAIWWETSNSIYGRTNNPYDLRRIAGGSSGGETALLASAGSVIGLGNDLAGSLRLPASLCGVFGLKPGPGVIPSSGIFPPITGKGHIVQMCTAGPLCRYAEDLPLLLRVLAGNETVDKQLRLSEPVDFTKVRVFYMEHLHQLFCEDVDTTQKRSVRKTVDFLTSKFGVPAEPADLQLAHHALEMFVISFDQADYPKLTEAMADYKVSVVKLESSQLPHPGQKIKQVMNSKRDQLRSEIIEMLGEDGILLFPSFATVAPFHNHGVWTPFNFIYNALWNTLGLPALSCPLGLSSKGMPTAVQIIGSPNSERLLIAAAKQLEVGFGGWTPPGDHNLKSVESTNLLNA
ncbi:amidase domain-containing protein [Ditylenchus destructor]|uniref:Amidase domain-containing protein n=1 Tax=Ditylenchus destructor TaxID=166010 RepID=A0AAD4MN06_9BILA|nr:amidase domain-containing protein [Ditylenchus destructor]